MDRWLLENLTWSGDRRSCQVDVILQCFATHFATVTHVRSVLYNNNNNDNTHDGDGSNGSEDPI